MLRIRLFRAIDDLPSCQKFVEGHMKILKAFGITMITSANIEWFVDPYTYVIVAESKDSGRVLGGARIQMAGGSQELPIEKAVCEMDNNIFEVIKDYSKQGTAELCGLWNSREVAGMGIGSVFLTRTAVSVAPRLNIKSMWALCAPYTVRMAQNAGFEIATTLGNNGTFYYPKEDLLATAMVLQDTSKLDTADPQEKNEILSLRSSPRQIKEEGRREKFMMEYDLLIPNTLQI